MNSNRVSVSLALLDFNLLSNLHYRDHFGRCARLQGHFDLETMGTKKAISGALGDAVRRSCPSTVQLYKIHYGQGERTTT